MIYEVPVVTPPPPIMAPPPESPSLGDLLRQALAQLSVRQLELSAAHEQYGSATPDAIPTDGMPWHESASINLPASPSAETTVLSFRVPAGFDGLITSTGHTFEGGGFTPGSGEILWRYSIDGAYLRGMHALAVEFGDATLLRDLPGAGLRVYENQTITLSVEHVTTGALNGLVTGQLAGYYWNRR